MGKFKQPKSIPIRDPQGASAFIFDLRNSTATIRSLSSTTKIHEHVEYMRKLHEFIYLNIYGMLSTGSNKDEFAINDTGDGYICVFWNKDHAITCMNMATKVRKHLVSTLPAHNVNLNISPELSFGFAAHSGGVNIVREEYNDRGGRIILKDFIIGTLANSVSRFESLNKVFVESDFVVSGNYKECFTDQAKAIPNKTLAEIFLARKKHVKKSPGRANVNDGHPKGGHFFYILRESFFEYFSNNSK